MSLQTWKWQYFKEWAHEVPKENAVAHSLSKWTGLRLENRKAHDVELSADRRRLWSKDVPDGRNMILDSSSCALCHKYYDPDYDLCGDEEGESDEPRKDCQNCPLALARDGYPCDQSRPKEVRSPWAAWTDTEDPEPMIFWLEKAATYEKENQK